MTGTLDATDPVALTVVYDETCELCRRCRSWLTTSPQLVPIDFVAAGDTRGVAELGLNPAIVPVGDELVVVGDAGPGRPSPIWVGPDAFITCLWALRDHRDLASRLQRPAMRPVAKAAFHALSAGRGSISKTLSDAEPVLAETCNIRPVVR